MCLSNEHILPALLVMRTEQNTVLNAKTEQFITAKVSGNALKQESRTNSQCYISAVHTVTQARSQFKIWRGKVYFRQQGFFIFIICFKHAFWI